MTTSVNIARDQNELPRGERQPLAPTLIGRTLRELGIINLGKGNRAT